MGASRAEKLGIFFWKLFLLKVHFQDGGQLYAHCLFYILIIWRKFLPFYFLNRGIGIKMGGSLVEKLVIFFSKIFFLKLIFQDKIQLYASSLFDILTI